jgi:hypothetical protein
MDIVCRRRESLRLFAPAVRGSQVPAMRRFSAIFIAVCMVVIAWMFRTGYRLKQ